MSDQTPATEVAAAPVVITETNAAETAASMEADERTALINAAEGIDPGADEAAAAAVAAKEGKAAEAAPVTEEPALTSKMAVAIRAREQAQKERDAGKSDAERIVTEAKAERERIIADAKAEARKAIQDEQTAFRARFSKSPLQAIKDQGIDARTLVDEVQREGSPEWQAQKRLEAELAEVKAQNQTFKQWQEEMSARTADSDKQAQARARVDTERRFVGLIPEGAALRTLYDEREILTKAHAAADYIRETTGEVASFEDLRDYLEEQAAQRLARIRHEPADSKSPAAKSKASNGPRTPSASSAGERRTSPKPSSDFATPAEERDALKKAADDAMSAYGKT